MIISLIRKIEHQHEALVPRIRHHEFLEFREVWNFGSLEIPNLLIETFERAVSGKIYFVNVILHIYKAKTPSVLLRGRPKPMSVQTESPYKIFLKCLVFSQSEYAKLVKISEI